MDFSQIKLIVSDMDGTLLNSRHEVSPEFFELFPKLRKNGILFAVASGRQYYSLRERMDRIKDELIYIAENGAIVMENGEQKHIQPMQPEKVQEIINKVRELGGRKYLVLCGKEQAYIESTDPEFIKPFLEHYEKYKVVDALEEVKDDVFLKLTICDLDGAEENSLPHVKHFQNELQVKLAGKIWVDFNHKEAQKGNALKAVQQLLDISKEETMAFGDFLNDIELFDHAGIGYAVANAHPEVKKAAQYLTASNDENGVEQVLGELLQEIEVKTVE
jgi:Cof subfamily protein (haloacid dehalogenase superfamily)